MASAFRVESATESDIEDIISLLIPTFSHIPVEQILGNVDTPKARKAMIERHLQAWRDHARKYAEPCAIKCVHTDAPTKTEKLVGFAYWFIYDKARRPDEYGRIHSLLSGDWLCDEDRAHVERIMKPVHDGRVKWIGGRPCAILMYMAVDGSFRRQGAATLCLQWGLERCKTLGIPAYLEATDEGAMVYRKLGFVEVETISMNFDGVIGSFPAMVWWPPEMPQEERKPVVDS